MPIQLSELTAEWLKLRYFQGIPLTTPDGGKIPDEVFQHFIDAVVAEMEGILDLAIRPATGIVERHDFRIDQWRRWSYIRVRRRPCTAVTRLDVKYGSDTVFTFPLDWVRLEGPWGQIHLFPSLGTFASPPELDNAYTLAPILLSNRWAPHLFEVEYNGGLSELDDDLTHAIGMMAAVNLFAQLGDIVLGAGIASLSLSLDGLSQSIGTTASAMFNAYSARFETYAKMLWGDGTKRRGLLQHLKEKHKPILTMWG